MPNHLRPYLVHLGLLVVIAAGLGLCRYVQAASVSPEVRDDRYTPIPGGWQIRLRKAGDYPDINQRRRAAKAGSPAKGIDLATGRLTSDAPIGLLLDNPRQHRRPLFPPADKSLVWTDEQCARMPTVTFRPIVLAYNAPRFLFDYHSAGGLLGHLYLGLAQPSKADKWFHDWSDIDVRYVDGRMEYLLRDESFKDTTVRLVATPLANSAGLIIKVEVEGAGQDAFLVWAYGGASGFFTNYRFNAPEFNYAPEQCRKDEYLLKENTFELIRKFDKTDGIVGGEGQSLSATRFLPEWQAHIVGGSSWHGTTGSGDPAVLPMGPGKSSATTGQMETRKPDSPTNCVVVEKVPLDGGKTSGFVVVGMGGNIREAIAQPAAAYDAALARNRSIADRIVTHTPDPYLDAAMPMMAFATEGTWASQAYVHGGWSWRFAYQGWRILYGPTCYGWTDRVRKSIRNHCRLGRIEDGPDKGALSSMLESKGFYYNMNEVFFDMVRHYYEYTDDQELMKEIFPVLEGVLERENRRLRPGPEYLYESALNTWISDSHWYIRGQCTQASAYMLRAYEFMADLAHRLGKDDRPFRDHAARIRQDMQRVLWQKRPGVFAEYKDTRGQNLLHPEPELPTIYHSAEFGATDRLQIYQMLHWADTHLRQERTPGAGRLYWSSNWFPNNGRSYTHSTYELAYGEELNFAETNYLAGRSDIGYALIRAGLSGIFNGPTPGGLSCHCFIDGTQRANDEFADASSMWGRAVVEGLFGIKVKRPEGLVELTPQPPDDWPEASIHTPHFGYRMQRGDGVVKIDWESPVPTAVRLKLPLRTAGIRAVSVNGANMPHQLREGVGLTWLEVSIPRAAKGTIEVTFVPETVTVLNPVPATRGRGVTLTFGAPIAKWDDPQGLLAGAKIEGGHLLGYVDVAPGPGVLFVSEARKDCPRWVPVPIDVRSAQPLMVRAWFAFDVPDRRLGRWSLIDLTGVYNASVPEVPKRLCDGAIPPEMPADQVGFGYWKDHVVGRSSTPSDAAWRAKVGPDGVAWTTDGIPFKTTREGPDIGAVCLFNKAFPAKLSFPVKSQGKTLYLMISGMTHPCQSDVVNLRVVLHYADGTEEAHDLVSPFDIGDCWSTWCGLHFDTPANGFENIGGRSGPPGSSKMQDHDRPVAVDTIAHLIAVPLRKGAQLDSVAMEAIANDVVFGIMGASVLK
jgi:hypothetical protein